jgi:hypothetical protein
VRAIAPSIAAAACRTAAIVTGRSFVILRQSGSLSALEGERVLAYFGHLWFKVGHSLIPGIRRLP